jgi:HlyD family secretion protein
VRVVLDFDKATLGEAARRLGHDYRVFVQISVVEVSDAILVPLGALFRNENRWSTYVAANGRAELRALEIGNRDQLTAEVLRGLSVKERIILHPSDRIAHGVRIAERVVSR